MKKIAQIFFRKRFKILFDITKTKNIFELDDYFHSIKKFAKLEQNFKILNINIEKDYNKIIKGVNEQRLKNNPIKLKKKI